MQDNQHHQMMSIKDVANELQISYTKARILVHGNIKHIKIGNSYRITRHSFNEFLGMTDNNTENIYYELRPY